MSDQPKKSKLPPLSSLDFEQLKENYIEFLSLANKPEKETKEGIRKLLLKAKAQKEERERKKQGSSASHSG